MISVARWTLQLFLADRETDCLSEKTSASKRGDGAAGRRGDKRRKGTVEESRRKPAESSAVHIRGCAACQTRGPLRISFTGGPWMGALLHRKIRPPGASRRRATDIHVTLLPYRYQSRRHNTARRTYTTVIHVGEEREEIGRQQWEGGREGHGKREREGGVGRGGGEIILYFSFTNRFDTFLPPFVSNVAYTRWTTVRETRKQLPLTTGSRDERVETSIPFVCGCV